MVKCVAITDKGKNCHNNVKCGKSRCRHHCDDKMATCSICIEEIRKKAGETCLLKECGHYFCKRCIYSWIIQQKNSNSCPYCRKHINHKIIFSAKFWGFCNGLMFNVQVRKYDLSKLLRNMAMVLAEYIDTHEYYILDDQKFKEVFSGDIEIVMDILEECVHVSYNFFNVSLFEKHPGIIHIIDTSKVLLEEQSDAVG
jgi:hypothetical protein